MKIKSGFILREVAGSTVAVPVGSNSVTFNGMITLSETGVLLWKKLEDGATQDQLISALLEEYDVDVETAGKDVKSFTDNLIRAGILEQ
ncbi:MAG: PqqD family protein [Clostridia bacterium]|nr:PqqD family protein [Clostridia bacterium]